MQKNWKNEIIMEGKILKSEQLNFIPIPFGLY